MTERERLIKLIEQCSCHYSPPCTGECGECHNVEMYDRNIEHIADHLLANGVIVPPVRVGQKVWYIKGGYYNSAWKHPCEIEVTEINHKWSGKILAWGFIANGTRYRFSSIGKTVFLTREDAEKALAERRTT